MKENNDIPTLEQLLQAVEHAGRDQRRRQQLSQMIEQMAEAETSKSQTVRLWVARVAVAAMITLFVVVPVWNWIGVDQSVEMQVSQVPVSIQTRDVEPVAVEVEQKRDYVARQHARTVNRTLPDLVEPECEELDNTSDVVVVESQPVFYVQEETVADNLEPIVTDPVVEEVLPVVPSKEPEQVAQSMPRTDAKRERRSFFSFLSAEPSMMDGTMLAFQLL